MKRYTLFSGARPPLGGWHDIQAWFNDWPHTTEIAALLRDPTRQTHTWCQVIDTKGTGQAIYTGEKSRDGAWTFKGAIADKPHTIIPASGGINDFNPKAVAFNMQQALATALKNGWHNFNISMPIEDAKRVLDIFVIGANVEGIDKL